jgi:signal transduction histidine kinase
MLFERRGGIERADRGQEYFLAIAYLVLDFACILTSYLYPAVLGNHVALGRLLILAYFAYGVSNWVVVLRGGQPGLTRRLSSHAAHVTLASAIIAVTGGAHSLFVPLYLFVLIEAASRWGVAGAIPAIFACIVILMIGWGAPPSWSQGIGHWVDGGIYFNAIIAALILSAYFLCLWLIEKQKRQLIEAGMITRLVRKALHEPSLRANIGNILKSVREYFDADQVGLVTREITDEQAFLWEANRPTPAREEEIKSWCLAGGEREEYFAKLPEGIWRLVGLGRVGGSPQFRAEASVKRREELHSAGRSNLSRLSAPERYNDGLYDLRMVSEQIDPNGDSGSQLATSFSFEKKWFGRITVHNPRRGGDSQAKSRFLAALIGEIGPVIYNKFLVGRLRLQAQTKERLRLAQELHDGVIQSLIGVEMQIDLLRRAQEKANGSANPLGDLKRLQDVLHNEIANFREQMQRVRPLEVEPDRLMDCLAGMVEKFQRDLDISASFVAQPQEVSLPPRVCAELVRIVQEALANIRKHSGAHKVQVILAQENGHWKLCVEDDGRGFGFNGRRSLAELEGVPECPAIIRERVRSIGGELMIESVPGSGAKLEILVPMSANGRFTYPN